LRIVPARNEQSARYSADKGALCHYHRAALSIYRWCERSLRSRSTPQRSVKHAGSTIPRTILDIRIPPRARGDQSPPTGQGDAHWRPPHGAFAKSPADRCCRRDQQVVDLAGTTAAILNLVSLPGVKNFCTPSGDQPVSGFYNLAPGAGKPPPALHFSGRRFCLRRKAVGCESATDRDFHVTF